MLKCFSNENAEAWRRRMFFTYMKGVVTQAVEQGHWLLVDEINLASSECLDVLVEVYTIYIFLRFIFKICLTFFKINFSILILNISLSY